MDRFHVRFKRCFNVWWIALAVILTGCGSGGIDGNNRADTEMAKVSTAIEGLADLEGDGAKPGRLSAKPVPSGVASIRLEVKRGEMELHSECKNVSVGDDPVLFNFEVASGSGTDFSAQAFSAADCAGNLLYEGETIGLVLLDASGTPTPGGTGRPNVYILEIVEPLISRSHLRDYPTEYFKKPDLPPPSPPTFLPAPPGSFGSPAEPAACISPGSNRRQFASPSRRFRRS